MTKYIVIYCFLAFSCFSQPLYQDAASLKKCDIVVGLLEEDPSILKKLAKKPERLTEYRDQIKGVNEAMRYAMEHYWKISGPISYLPYKEAQALYQKEPSKHAYLGLEEYYNLDYEIQKMAGWHYDPVKNLPTYNPETKYFATETSTAQLSLRHNGRTFMEVRLPSFYVSIPDAVYGVTMSQDWVNRFIEDKYTDQPGAVEYHKYGTMLQKKTLLLSEGDLEKGMTKEQVAKTYPFPFEIVSDQKLDSTILSQDPMYAYVQITVLGVGGNSYKMHMITNAENGRLLGYTSPNAIGSFMGIKITAKNTRIKEGHLKEYAEIASGKTYKKKK